MKIKLTISYDGSEYYGSAIQPSELTVASKLYEVFDILNIKTTIDFSGRTDRDVHAFRQVISCEVPKHWEDLKKLKRILNKMLPGSILVRGIEKAEDDFHARFSAKKREYRYIFTNKQLTPFNSKYISFYKEIDEELIEKSIKYLEGIHDFEYFCKKGSEPKSTIREIYKIRFYKYKDVYVLNFQANSYLRSQIRMMVDFIMKVSSKKLTIEDLENQLSKKKLVSWTLAEPNGLYLSKIIY